MPSLGSALKLARINAGFTQKEVEDKLRLRTLMMKDYETERLKLPLEMAMELAKLYQVNLDQLVGSSNDRPPKSEQAQSLSLLKAFFTKPQSDLVFLDPVIRAYVEERKELLVETTLIQTLMDGLSEKDKRFFIQELLKTLSSLMGSDGKVGIEEQRFLQDLIETLNQTEKSRPILKGLTFKHELPHDFLHGKPHLKHFLIWALYFLAASDGKVVFQEESFIDECAEKLRLNKSNYLFIKRFFVKESY